LIAAAAVGAAMFLGGCASEGPFTKNAGSGREEPTHNQAKADSFPTAQEAEISR
jgi:PBP1b-binding outer membrane lipoprotein LpoB